MYHIYVDFDDREDAPGRDALRDFGFDEAFLRDYLAAAEPEESPARIVEVQRGRYTAVTRAPDGGLAEVEAVAAGRLLHGAAAQADLPAVGDWVFLKPSRDGAASIRSVLPRKSSFARRAACASENHIEAQVLAANVDTAFIVAAAGRDWNPRRIERYVTLAYESGVEPVIVVTKADLAADAESLEEAARMLCPGVSSVLVCAPEGRGLDGLSSWLAPGKTVVLLGSSGAGKSTLLNALAGKTLASTGRVRADDERGRHTTTHRELFRLDSGALVIDNPGLREVGVIAGGDAVADAFADVSALAADCRFRDCRHEAEPGCAVRAAIESGNLDAKRYASYLKLGREAAHAERQVSLSARRAEADRWRVINKSMRGYSKERRSIQGRSR